MCKGEFDSEGYANSYRYKLHIVAYKTGFDFKDLSVEMGMNPSYLSNVTSKSRYQCRKDISYRKYIKILEDIIYAERSLLDLKPKTLDDDSCGEIYSKQKPTKDTLLWSSILFLFLLIIVLKVI